MHVTLAKQRGDGVVSRCWWTQWTQCAVDDRRTWNRIASGAATLQRGHVAIGCGSDSAQGCFRAIMPQSVCWSESYCRSKLQPLSDSQGSVACSFTLVSRHTTVV